MRTSWRIMRLKHKLSRIAPKSLRVAEKRPVDEAGQSHPSPLGPARHHSLRAEAQPEDDAPAMADGAGPKGRSGGRGQGSCGSGRLRQPGSCRLPPRSLLRDLWPVRGAGSPARAARSTRSTTCARLRSSSPSSTTRRNAFVEGVRSAADLLIKAGVSVPGVSVRTESGVA